MIIEVTGGKGKIASTAMCKDVEVAKIYNSTGKIICLCMELDNGGTFIVKADDKEFHELVRSFGSVPPQVVIAEA